MNIGKLALAAITAIALNPVAGAQDAIQVGDVIVDPASICCVGVVVPILAGDDNRNATATIEYRLAGAQFWTSGLSLLRVRPELISGETPPSQYGLPAPDDQFAGSVFDLQDDESYVIRVAVDDPDGGSREQVLAVQTRPIPRSQPSLANIVPVSSDNELALAISQAAAGDVIELQPGTYSGPLILSNSGNSLNPLVLRGVDRDTVIVAAGGFDAAIVVAGDYTHIESLTVEDSNWGVRIDASENDVIRYLRIRNVNRGISAKSGTQRNHYICDNILEGRFTWPTIDSNTWDEEGITVSGEGHHVCHNTLSGFGDALGLANDTAIVNRAIDFVGNDVLWTGDDGLELDFAHHNVRAIRNRITNSGMGVSFQPVWGGPVYVIRNLLLNTARAPFKLNNDPSGFYILHNTAARTNGVGNYGGDGWPQLGYIQSDGDPAYAANFTFRNNIVIGATNPARVTTDLILADLDTNGWYPDGTFVFVDSYSDLLDLQARSPYESQSLIVDPADFEVPLLLPADYTTTWGPISMQLSSGAAAVDAATVYPNINDGFSGSAPDLGAIELGSADLQYGVRDVQDRIAPMPPTNVQVE